MYSGNWQEEYAYTSIELQIKPVYNNVQNNKTLGQNPTATLALESTNMNLALQYCQCCVAEISSAMRIFS